MHVVAKQMCVCTVHTVTVHTICTLMLSMEIKAISEANMALHTQLIMIKPKCLCIYLH